MCNWNSRQEESNNGTGKIFKEMIIKTSKICEGYKFSESRSSSNPKQYE